MCIDLGKALNSLISSATTTTIVNKVFPLEAPLDIIMPFVVYEITDLPEYTKDGIAGYDSTANIYVISNNYSQGIDIGKTIIAMLQFYKGIVEGIHIIACRLESSEGTVADQVFSQKLTFTLRNF
jgi:hypothetical protein